MLGMTRKPILFTELKNWLRWVEQRLLFTVASQPGLVTWMGVESSPRSGKCWDSGAAWAGALCALGWSSLGGRRAPAVRGERQRCEGDSQSPVSCSWIYHCDPAEIIGGALVCLVVLVLVQTAEHRAAISFPPQWRVAKGRTLCNWSAAHPPCRQKADTAADLQMYLLITTRFLKKHLFRKALRTLSKKPRD